MGGKQRLVVSCAMRAPFNPVFKIHLLLFVTQNPFQSMDQWFNFCPLILHYY